jgi:hypothetical protein
MPYVGFAKTERSRRLSVQQPSVSWRKKWEILQAQSLPNHHMRLQRLISVQGIFLHTQTQNITKDAIPNNN